MRSRAAVALVLLVAAAAGADDRPVAGRRLALRAGATPERRVADVVLADPAIATPLPDPRAARTTLVFHGGAAPGQCFVALDLDPAGWAPLRGDGPRRGWRWDDPAGGAAGVRRVRITPGRIRVAAGGAGWPCGLEQPQRLPLTVTLAIDGAVRWCAAFDAASARVNAVGKVRAVRATPPATCPATRLDVVSFNVLHGLFCPAGTANCRFAERMALAAQHVEAAGCPDAVGLQEVHQPQVPTLLATLGAACGGYASVYVPTNVFDDALLLVRHPAAVTEVVTLYRGFRNVLHVRLDHPLGPVDLFVTHLASGSDGAAQPCAADCPPECVAAGAANVRDCQAVQVAALATARHDVATPALVVGDFNESPGSFAYTQLTAPGWSDAYLAVGRPECVAATGVGCSSGREDEALADLESPALGVDERIDFAFVIPPAAGACTLDPAATALFAAVPNPFAPACGPAPLPVCWPSDHDGMRAALDCR